MADLVDAINNSFSPKGVHENCPEKERPLPQIRKEAPFVIKLVSLLKKREDLTGEEFKAYWLKNRVQVENEVVQTTPVKKIAASFATGEVIGGEKPIFDGTVELYSDTLGDLKAAFASPVLEMMLKDEANFVDRTEEVNRMVTEEYVQAESERWMAMAADRG